MKKLKIIIVFIICLIIFYFLFNNIKNKDYKFQDDIIFFKSFSSEEDKKNSQTKINNQNENLSNSLNKIEKTPMKYVFNVSYKNIDFKNIKLIDTFDEDTLINKKIAPGTYGKFQILLQTNEKTNYQIKFEDENDKPKNLIFRLNEKDKKYESLKDMEKELTGEITKDKEIVIYWQWEYENNKNDNIQDTKDGENIKNYNFTIYVIGK